MKKPTSVFTRFWKLLWKSYEVQCVQQYASTLAKKFREGRFERTGTSGNPLLLQQKPPEDFSRSSPKLTVQSYYDSVRDQAQMCNNGHGTFSLQCD